MKRIVSFFAAFALCISLYAQQSEFITLAGKAIDGTSREPLKFVSVGLKGTNISNVTNSEGVFTLKVPAGTPEDAVVVLSCLGFNDLEARVTQFEGCTSDDPLLLAMIPAIYRLPAIVVGMTDAEYLVSQAYNSIKQNYPTTHVGMTAFYRELIKKGNTKYLSLNEAVLDIDKTSYTSFQADRAGIYKGRGTVNYDASDTLFVKYQGGVSSSLSIDLMKNPFAGVVLKDIFDVYDFSVEGSAVQDDRIFTVVSFSQRPEFEEMLFRGKMYIDPDTYAVGRVEFNMNVEGRPSAASLFILKSPAKTKFTVDEAAYVVNYKEKDGKWYYDYASINLAFTAKHKLSPFRQHYTISSELAITDFAPGQIEITDESRLRLRDQLSEKVSDFTDESFWENYNVIEPDASIDAIVRKIVRQLKRRETK